MTGATTSPARAPLWAWIMSGLLVAVFGSMAWNGYSLVAHRRDVAAQMRAVLEEHGEVIDVDLGPWNRAPTGYLCESLVRMTARLDAPSEQVRSELETRVQALVESVHLRDAPGHVIASALLFQPGEFALFGCS